MTRLSAVVSLILAGACCAETVMVSSGASLLGVSLDEGETEGPEATHAVTARLANRYLWLSGTGEFHDVDSGTADLSVTALTGSVLFRIDPLPTILYFGPGIGWADVELETDGNRFSARGLTGLHLQAGGAWQPKWWFGLDLQLLVRPENEIDVGPSEIELNTWSAALSYSVYF